VRDLLALLFLAAAGLAGTPLAAQERWAEYTDVWGTRVSYPQDLFSVNKGAEGGGQVFVTRDGRARLHIYAMENPKALPPRQFMRSYFPGPRSTLTYDRVARNFFAVSTRREGMIVYLRCNFSSAGGAALHCVDIRYPTNEKRAWDGIVTRISRSLRPLPAE
jgi:hypothetical protein